MHAKRPTRPCIPRSVDDAAKNVNGSVSAFSAIDAVEAECLRDVGAPKGFPITSEKGDAESRRERFLSR